MLKVSNLVTGYGKAEVIHGISFYVDKGEIVTLVGANGAGKTTTLKALCGVLGLNNGTVDLEGQYIHNKTPNEIVDLGITMIPEGRQLFPSFTVKENLLMGSYKRSSRKDARQRMEDILELFPRVRERLKQITGSLSGGEQQMVAIARGMMANPKLLIFDEPSLGLSPLLVQQMFDIVRTISSKGITVLLVEQNINHTLKISDRGYVLENGSISIEGTGNELLNNSHVRQAYLGL